MADTTELNESRLGTREYWDEFYALERRNFAQNPQDTGECWFDDNDAEGRMVQFLNDHEGDHGLNRAENSIIDLGTGNGHLLFTLRDEGFEGPMVGADYSAESVRFATEVARSRRDTNEIRFIEADIFSNTWNPGQFDIVLDKGTLDAIALSGIRDPSGRSIVHGYGSVIERILKPGGVFLITSCNFTQQELASILESPKLAFWESIKYPVFEFGGVSGNPICSIAFVKC